MEIWNLKFGKKNWKLKFEIWNLKLKFWNWNLEHTRVSLIAFIVGPLIGNEHGNTIENYINK